MMITDLRKKSVSLLLALAVFFAFSLAMTTEANAASSGKMTATTYSEVIKKGNTAYCASMTGIYKAKLKNKKVVSVKRLRKGFLGEVPRNMKLKGKYLYYTCAYPVGEYMGRINLKTGKDQDVFVPGKGHFKNSMSVSVLAYAFKGSKLYAKIEYDNEDTGNTYTKTFVSKLNGKSPKKTKVKVSNKHKVTNAKGYKIVEKDTDDFMVKAYLKTPKGKYYLGKSSNW